MSDRDVDAIRGLLSGSDPSTGGPDRATRERIRQRSEQTALSSGPDRRRWWPQMLQAATVAAVVTAGAFVLLVGGVAETQQQYAGPLAKLADGAATQPEADGVEYLRYERNPELVNSFGPALEIWASDAQRYELQGKLVGGELNPAVEFFYDGSAGLSCIGRPPKRPPECGLPLPRSTELPTEPEELRAQVETDIRTALAEGQRSLQASLRPEAGVSGLTETADLDSLDDATRRALVAEETFSRLIALLADPLTSPEVRAAAFAVLGETQGVELLGEGRDRLDRAASIVDFGPPAAAADDRTDFRLFGAGSSYRLFVDPSTTEILEFRARPESDDHFYEVFSRREQVDSLPSGATPFIDQVAAQTGDSGEEAPRSARSTLRQCGYAAEEGDPPSNCTPCAEADDFRECVRKQVDAGRIGKAAERQCDPANNPNRECGLTGLNGKT